MHAALVQVCVDPLLDHVGLRKQLDEKLRQLRLSADRIYILGEVGGNIGSNFQHTLDMLKCRDDSVVLCAVLHHDNCSAAALGLRLPLEISSQYVESLLVERSIHCRVLTGSIRTRNSRLLWSDELTSGDDRDDAPTPTGSIVNSRPE